MIKIRTTESTPEPEAQAQKSENFTETAIKPTAGTFEPSASKMMVFLKPANSQVIRVSDYLALFGEL